MKKFLFLSLALSFVALTGCDRDREVTCDVDSFVMHCEGSDLVTCEVQPRSKRGVPRIVDQYTVNDVVYACSEDGDLVIQNACLENGKIDGINAKNACGYYGTVSCVDGVAVERVNEICDDHYADYPNIKKAAKCDGNNLMIESEDDLVIANHNAMCDPDKGVVVTCSDGQFVESQSLCLNGAAWTCALDKGAYALSEVKCSDAQSCVDFVRNGARQAGCFDKAAVSSDCGNVKVFGSCDADNGLVFCSSDDGKGKLLRIDCNAEGKKNNVNKVCGLVEDNYGYDCQITCEDADGQALTDFGKCVDNTLHYCNQQGEVAEPIECASSTCAWDDHYYNCMD